MNRAHSARKRASSACFSWSTRFSTNVWCCITALLIWLLRKFIPRSMSPPVNRLLRGSVRLHKTRHRRVPHARVATSATAVELELAGEHPPPNLRKIGGEWRRGIDREILQRVEERAPQSAAGITLGAGSQGGREAGRVAQVVRARRRGAGARGSDERRGHHGWDSERR